MATLDQEVAANQQEIDRLLERDRESKLEIRTLKSEANRLHQLIYNLKTKIMDIREVVGE